MQVYLRGPVFVLEGYFYVVEPGLQSDMATVGRIGCGTAGGKAGGFYYQITIYGEGGTDR